ncbi:histidine kinase [Lysinibacillus contaminans]|uniref:histidine kinase n=1 Tax=Lysinibacillus contaminans TaxID=1293441 RepID=A0ABR5K155_9BACI|nr:HAMP domain-containing sensor histidine kinase [Lysinibacillus contaminans]KOS68647.1 histidine kinase [Lysinibacillus contaminans]
MRNIKLRNKLTVKLLGTIAISFFVTFFLFVIISQLVFHLVGINYFIDISEEKARLMAYLVLSLIILNFIVVFLLLVRKKFIYLRHISESVNQIANGNLGLTIEIEGKDELSQLAQNINYMSKELENKFIHERQLEKAKNELITNVSHDLRTPLTSIIGYLDLIKNEQYENKDQFYDYFETIYSKSHRLKHLIDELFEFTRLSSPDVMLNLNKVELASLLQQIVGEYIPIFEEEQLSVRNSITDEDIPVLIDVEKMVRVYENLFMNAIKYSIKPSDIQISFKSKGNTAVLQVSNRVEKPPVEDVNKMFERFFRGDQARMDAQGTGLGLSISKRIVELHNGVIRAKYKDGWIIFIVELPIYNEQLKNS